MNIERDAVVEGADPTAHYDHVVDAWAYLLEDDLHYGYFTRAGESLAEATDALTDEMMVLADCADGSRVLDVGCGTGRAACRLATELGCDVIGLSPSTACVQRSRDRALTLALESARFVAGDGMALPYADFSFDVAWVMESSHLMADKKRLLQECSRVLRPGGVLVLCDITLARKLSLEEVIDHRDDFLLLKEVFGRARMEPLEYYECQVREAGLQPFHSRNITEQTRPTFEHWRENAMNHGVKVAESIGDSARDRFLASCSVLEKFWDQDILRYGILAARKS